MMRQLLVLGLAAAFTACGSADERSETTPPEGAEASQAPAPVGTVATACQPVERMPVEGRASAYDSTLIELGGSQAKLCYGRPSMRGRQIFGGLVPYDTLWRTGANEPTTLHLPFAAEIAGLRIDPGSYSIYTVPGDEEWTVIVNRSTSQWGIESQYTPEVRAQEVGRARVPAERTGQPVETFVITSESTGPNSADLILEWENTQVRIPVVRV